MKYNFFEYKYKNRKLKEVEYLSKYLNKENFEIFNNNSNKTEIKNLIKKQTIEKFKNFPETNLSYDENKNIEIFPGLLINDYTYQRSGFNFTKDFLVKKLYELEVDGAYYTFFTNCGMTSITNLLMSLNYIGGFNICLPQDCYYELTEFIKYNTFNKLIFNNNLNTLKENVRNILYVDSVSTINPYKILLKDIQKKKDIFIIIIDSSCFDLNHNKIFKNILNKILLSGIFVVILRSHMKLDFMGTEYSRLGSTTFITPKTTTINKLELFQQIINSYNNIQRIMGTTPNLYDIPEFMVDKNIKDLNSIRINQIKNNTKLLYDILITECVDKFKIIKPYHELFIIIKITKELDLIKIRKIIREFLSKLFIKGYNFVLGASFGLDVIVFDAYKDIEGKYNLRISLSDYPKNIIIKLAKKLLILVNNI